jgi:hypothetical protein
MASKIVAGSTRPFVTSKLSKVEGTLATWIRKSDNPPTDSAIETEAQYFAELFGDGKDRQPWLACELQTKR